MGEQQAGCLEGIYDLTDSLIGRWRISRHTLGRIGIRLGYACLRARRWRFSRDCICYRLLPTDWWRVHGFGDGYPKHDRIRTELCDHSLVYRYGFAELFHYRRVCLRCLYGDILTVHVEGKKPTKILREDIRALCCKQCDWSALRRLRATWYWIYR